MFDDAQGSPYVSETIVGEGGCRYVQIAALQTPDHPRASDDR